MYQRKIEEMARSQDFLPRTPVLRLLPRVEQASQAALRAKGNPMTTALRQASNALVTAARLYKELALSASDLFRAETYRSR